MQVFRPPRPLRPDTVRTLELYVRNSGNTAQYAGTEAICRYVTYSCMQLYIYVTYLLGRLSWESGV